MYIQWNHSKQDTKDFLARCRMQIYTLQLGVGKVCLEVSSVQGVSFDTVHIYTAL